MFFILLDCCDASYFLFKIKKTLFMAFPRLKSRKYFTKYFLHIAIGKFASFRDKKVIDDLCAIFFSFRNRPFAHDQWHQILLFGPLNWPICLPTWQVDRKKMKILLYFIFLQCFPHFSIFYLIISKKKFNNIIVNLQSLSHLSL